MRGGNRHLLEVPAEVGIFRRALYFAGKKAEIQHIFYMEG